MYACRLALLLAIGIAMPSGLLASSHREAPINILRPLGIGIVHGLLSSAAVALLVMTTIHNPWRAVVYLLLFGIGTIAGMMLITAVLAMPFAFTSEDFPASTAAWPSPRAC
jgi:sulfite exporter TauE/SafE